jgi:hypothetical protein
MKKLFLTLLTFLSILTLRTEAAGDEASASKPKGRVAVGMELFDQAMDLQTGIVAATREGKLCDDPENVVGVIEALGKNAAFRPTAGALVWAFNRNTAAHKDEDGVAALIARVAALGIEEVEVEEEGAAAAEGDGRDGDGAKAAAEGEGEKDGDGAAEGTA